MKFDDLDTKMRVYETIHDIRALPGIYMVARIDGRNFTMLTKKKHPFDTPFDESFRDMMIQTTEHLMDCGFRVIYGYTESDEISLLFHPDETTFGRKLRKFNSILAGEASAKFSLLLINIGVFDCRISELPNLELVVDYFRWRNEDAHRNALNAHCYWQLRNQGNTAEYTTQFLTNKSVAEKNELLFSLGLNFNDIPNWQKRGIGLYREEYTKTDINRETQDAVTSTRRRIKADFEIPMKDEYSRWLMERIKREISIENSAYVSKRTPSL